MEKITIQILPELVRKQLQHILHQDDLKRSPILAKFLEFVVVSKLEGREDEIKEYTIGIKALGKPADFNPQLDAVVRIHASRLRNILFKHYHGAGKNDEIIIDIPKGTYVPVFDVNDTKTEKIQHYVLSQTEVNAYEKPRRQKGILLKPSLAVLPFHDLSPEHSNINFLTALGEQLSTELSRFDNLSVISYYATEKLNSGVKDLTNLQNEVGIDYILTGSLRLLNGTLRLNIQLMMVESGSILWSDSYLRQQLSDKNAMDVQDEIISQIANIVADDHGMAGTLNKLKPWRNLEEKTLIHDALIQYFDYTYNYDSEKFALTLSVIEKAYESENDNALITSILAKLYLDKYACAVEQDKNLFEKGMELTNKAIKLDPRSQHVQKALAWSLVLSGKKEKSAEAIDRCIAINPTASSNLGTMGLALIMQGEYENGFSMITQSVQLSQVPSACAKLGFSLYHYHKKDYNESLKWLDRLPPFNIPFSGLLNLAIQGKLHGKAKADESVSVLRGHEENIISRIALDPILKAEIMHGWKMAGFSHEKILSTSSLKKVS